MTQKSFSIFHFKLTNLKNVTMQDENIIPDNLFESNRSAWNEAMEYHRQARGGSLQAGFKDREYSTFDRNCDSVLIEKLEFVGLAGKTIAQLPCNNGRELLSLMGFGAEQAVVFDISDLAIEEAEQLTGISGLNAKFERVNILEISSEYDGRFDFVYISEGSLQWFPDLDEYFAVVGRLLKSGGHVLIFEMHPFAYFFETGFDQEKGNLDQLTPYFSKGPYTYRDGLDYVGGGNYEARQCFWFMHMLSDILNAVIRNGITIRSFDEYNLEMANNPATQFFDKFPLSYILVGEKE